MHQRIVQIVREEMDAIGGQEMLMPVMQPADLWRRSGRYAIEELFKLKDRRGADMVLAMTSEEVITTHVAAAVQSYRSLPQILYHFQVKERDEPRPRAGVLRTREFIMKDAYSFDRDAEAMDDCYRRHAEAYDRMCDRCGLEWYRVQADVGMMGGHGSDEYMAPCAAGENDIVLAPGYAANLEVASAEAQPVVLPDPLPAPEEVHTPGATTMDTLVAQVSVALGATLKAFPIVTERRTTCAWSSCVVIIASTRSSCGPPWASLSGPPGPMRSQRGSGPRATSARSAHRCRSCSTARSPPTPAASTWPAPTALTPTCAAWRPGRDFPFETVDVREVVAGDTVNGAEVRIVPAIEVGNIFKLGTRYSEPLGATYLDEPGAASSSGWAATDSGRPAPPPLRSSSRPTSRASAGPAPWRRLTSSW